jgi:thymidylate kinase
MLLRVLIALEGIDGSGKSTLARELTEVLGARGEDVVFVDKKSVGEAPPPVAARGRALSELIWSDEDPVDRFGTRYWMLLIAAWYCSLERFQPLLRQQERLVIVDGWYYRNLVKARLREDLDQDWLDRLFDAAPRPDLVVFVDLPPEVAWVRGAATFTALELGRWDGFDGEPRAAFCAYQSRVREELARISADQGWLRVVPAGGEEAYEVAEALAQAITSRAPRAQPATEAVTGGAHNGR